MRRTSQQRQIVIAEQALETEVRDIVYEELQRLFRSYKHKIRRIDQFRPKANVRGRPKLRKADYTTGTDLWELFSDRMQERLLNALSVGAISIHSIMAARWPDKVLEIDSEAIARQLQSGIGTMVTRVSKTIKRQVGRKIVGWYNTPGASMQTIVKQLMPTFELARAELIARTEITRLDSLVTEQIAQKIEATEWWWMTLRDQLVCTRNLTGPDGKTYAGCRALHGKTFKVGQPMPPDGSHIGCRCKAILIAPVSGTSRSTEPIIDLSHLTKAEWNEEDHPRAEDGRFEDKAGAGGSAPEPEHELDYDIEEGAVPRPTKALKYYLSREEVEADFGRHETSYANKLSPDEKEALMDYSTYGSELNEALRYGKMGKDDEEFMARIDAALDKASFPKQAEVHRYMVISGDEDLSYLQGKIIRDKGYMSTCLERDLYKDKVAEYADMIDAGDNTSVIVEMSIEIPRGAKAALLQKVGDVDSRSEVLLARNSRLAIRYAREVKNEQYQVGGRKTIHVSAVLL